MKILYLSYDGMTDQLGQSQVLPYLLGLGKLGHNIHLISCEKQNQFVKNSSLIKQLIDDSNIVWHPIAYHKTPPVFSTILDIRNIKTKAFDLQKKVGFDIVHCRSYITPFVGVQLQKKFGLKFIFDMRGFYADERVDGNIWNLKNPLYFIIYKYFKKKEREFLINADKIISLTNNALVILQGQKIKEEPLPIKVIPCCADLSLFNFNLITAEQRLTTRTKLNIKEEAFVLSYLGAIGTWYMLDEMLDFFKQMLMIKPDAVFLFITNEHPTAIEKPALTKQIPLECIKIISAQRSEVPSLLSISNLSIFFIKPTFSKRASSPTKQGEIMGMGIPLICNAGVGDTDYVVNKSECGFVIKNLDANGYKSAIDKIDELLRIKKEKIRYGAEEFYSLEKGVSNYNEIYNSLTTTMTQKN